MIVRRLAVLFVTLTLAAPAYAAKCGGDFNSFLSAMARDAQAQGVSQPVIQTAFAGLSIDGEVLAFDKRQRYTFRKSFEDYARTRVIPARIKRAWEVWRATGRPLSAWQDQTPPPVLPLSSTARAMVLTSDRDWLANRIDSRFLAMLEAGAMDEVRANLPFWDAQAPWAQAIGAPELVAHLRGEITLDEAISCAQAASRQYAKRQRTWFRSRMKAWEKVTLS